MILLVLLLTFVYTFFSFLVSMIRLLFVLGNFIEDPSIDHVCDVGILIKDYPHSFKSSNYEALTT